LHHVAAAPIPAADPIVNPDRSRGAAQPLAVRERRCFELYGVGRSRERSSVACASD